MARLQEIYSRTAAFYDAVAGVHQAPAKAVAIGLLNRRRGERFLEAGVGTAWAFVRVVGASGAAAAVGLDLAPGMLDVAGARLRHEGGLAYPPLVLGDACRLPFRSAGFDCLLSSYTLEVLPLPALAQALQEFHRVLRPGGRVVVAALTVGEGEDAVLTTEWMRGYLADPEYYGGARPLRLVPLLEEAGFREIVRRYSGHGEGWPSEVVRAIRP